MTIYKIKGQSGTVEQVITLSAESSEQALEEAKQYFPAWMHTCLSVTSDNSEYRQLLRKNGYPERVLDKLSDEECEGECDAVGII
ncbi:hypothetical protein EDM54_24200 [Brevibacillus borstelensis]|uniref:hypothetical protein n=1 Tax=Brevibacillus borstelensis TaxID=45462 RepID=UPI000F074B1A|nr:hypothetical protein [Brevibacillus borstelensis]MED1885964.1 hypothetical protein [Brevibacillus borstelensis]RNB56094.1 hypothetical protein EDM54_24200 [Brevibacillus borstelensis]GED55776.1 hypothetical protein BBO01nite_50170 [Brevibacillus borstelensis]